MRLIISTPLAVCLMTAKAALSFGDPGSVFWTDRTPPPSARVDHAIAYDDVRDVLVLFGGAGTGGSLLGDTWEMQGGLWTLKATTGPSPRGKHSMVFDAARAVVVLFGGDDAAPGSLGDTWEWDGNRWTRAEIDGPRPSPRHEHAMAYDASRGVTVLFGGTAVGIAGSGLGDTWEWNGTDWSLKATAGPAARFAHAMTYDSDRASALVFGGYSNAALGDTWEWNGETWTQVADGGPSPRTLHAMTFDEARGVAVLFGGYDEPANAISGETWEWDGDLWQLSSIAGATPRYQHAMTYGGAVGGVVLFGGFNSDSAPQSDTWTWDGSEWNYRPAETGPDVRAAHAMDYDSARSVAVLFGGVRQAALSDTWEWNGMAWGRGATTGPDGRLYHAVAFDSRRGVTVLFGGQTWALPPAFLGDTWEWNGTSWAERSGPGPQPRSQHAMAYDPLRGVTVLFGGGTPLSGETWEWNGDVWMLRATQGPSPRTGHAMTYDSVRRQVLLFGGNDGTLDGETWGWNGSAWTLLSTEGPSPRLGHGLCFDTIRGVAVLFGGQVSLTGQYDGQTWEWDGIGWDLMLAANGPSPRYVHAMTYDLARGRVVLFGGFDGLLDRRTWEYTPDCNADGVADTDDILLGTSPDCDANRIPDGCQEDCNANATADVCDLAGGTSSDCDSNGIPDDCEPDCNANGFTDACDLADGTSLDCNSNGVPDECEPDCNSNGVTDACDLQGGASQDCNGNATPDECDVAGGGSQDCNGDGIPDECELPGIVDSQWAGGAGAWSHAPNWCPPQVPDNSIDATYRVLVANLASQVTLDISPTLDSLEVSDGATIAINAASGAAVRTLAVGSPIQNHGTLLARDGGRLLVDASDIQQSAQGVMAGGGGPGEASKLQINGRRISGGIARTSGDSAAIELLGGAVLADVRIEGNIGTALYATVVVPNQQSGTIVGLIQNQGRIDVDAITNPTTLKPGADGAILGGKGVLMLRSPPPAPLAELGADSRTLTNSADHRIEGAGTILGGFVNYGVLDANTPGGRIVLSENGRKALGPGGSYRASSGGTLAIQKRVNHPPEDPPLGTLAAVGGMVQLRHPKGDSIVVRCATAEASSNGVIELADASRLELTGILALAAGGRLRGLAPASSTLAAASVQVLGEGSQLMLTEGMSAQVSGELSIVGGGCCRSGARGCICPLVGLDGSSVLESGSLAVSNGGVLEMGGAASAIVMGPVTLESGGVFRTAGRPSAGLMAAGSVLILGGAEGGQLLLEDEMTLHVSGDLSLGVPGGGCRGGDGERGCIRPLLAVTEFSDLDVDGSLQLQDSADLLVEASITFSLAGDFGNRSTDPLAFDWATGPLTLDGAVQSVEAAGADVGPDPAGLVNNFAIGELTLAMGTMVSVVDGFDNQQDGSAACDEALYVNSLMVNAGATLATAGCRIYYNSLVNHGSIPGLGIDVIGMSGPDSDGDGVPDSADLCSGFNDFADCDSDGVPDGCDSEPDCNSNGLPDTCESIAPCAHIIGAASWRTHGGGVGRDEIGINPAGRVEVGGVTSEPRIGGLLELRIAFDVPPGAPGLEPLAIEERRCGDGGAFVAYPGASTAVASVESHELVVTFTPALPNGRTYRFTVGPTVSAAPGQSIEVRALAGDANSSGRVNGADRSAVVAVWTAPGRYSPETDLDLSGRTDTADRSVLVNIWTGAENCAP